MNIIKFNMILLLLINLTIASMFDQTNSELGSVRENSVSSTGKIYFHGYVPNYSTNEFSDNLILDGDNYTDLIMSNYIAGVLLGSNLSKKFPGINFNKDYIYGILMGQLLQENLSTEDYLNSSNLIDPSASQSSVMGVGQGGPYQINEYFWDLVNGSFSPSGYSLTNYVAIQKNIGFTMLQQPSQNTQVTPYIFNNKFFGPVLASYFHYNDMRALTVLTVAPNFNKCMSLLTNITDSPLDIVLNYAYNQGFYGGLVNTFVNDCVQMSSTEFLNKYNNYNNAGPNTGINTYQQYPYQVRFYLDEFYSTSILGINNSVYFHMTQLRSVFVNIFNYIAYIDKNNNYLVINSKYSGTAFDNALLSLKIQGSASLNLSDKSQREIIFSIIETAIKNLETTLSIDFSKTTLNQIGVPLPPCPNNAVVYPKNSDQYTVGTVVIGSDKNFYSCSAANWCNGNVSSSYAPITGIAWSSAWSKYQCK